MSNSQSTESLKKTELYEWHCNHGAKMVDFAGWCMPLQYQSILREHKAVREQVGLFDVSHMGEIWIEGEEAKELIQYTVTNDVSKLEIGQALYTPMCTEEGGILDDLLVYRFQAKLFMLVVNAARTEIIDDHLNQLLSEFNGVQVDNRTDEWSLLALQGPQAKEVLSQVISVDLQKIMPFTFLQDANIGDVPVVVSRTGYTGEDGFELYLKSGNTESVWLTLLDKGSDMGIEIEPCGLGARDTLRLEAALSLYGQELTEQVTPLETRLTPFVKLDKSSFVGRKALLAQKEKGVERRLVGLTLQERGIPRTGYPVIAQGKQIGEITSGTLSPTLGLPIGLALIDKSFSQSGTEVKVQIRNREHHAKIVSLPFYKRKEQ